MNRKDLSSDLRYLISSCGRIFKQLLTVLLHNDIMYITHKGRKNPWLILKAAANTAFVKEKSI